MQINVSDFKAEINKLNSLLNDYENIYLNFYNEINKSSFFWNDNNSIMFYDETNIEKLKVRQTISEIKNLENLFTFIHDKYSHFGRVIRFDLENTEEIFRKFNKCNEQIKALIRSHNNLDLNSSPEIYNVINENYTILTSMQDNLQLLKTNTRNALNKIENIEKDVKRKLSNFDIEYIKESDISTYI